MASTLITNIALLVNTRESSHVLRGTDMSCLPAISNAFLRTEDDTIADYGSMKELEGKQHRGENVIDASGKLLLPGWCDSHTHLVFAGSREGEFVDKLKGLTYAAIAAKGGGILKSARDLHEATEDELFLQAWKRLEDISLLGTGAIEIKSGYGLNVQDELKMLRVIRKLKEKTKMIIRSTFLGAHTFPPSYREDHEGYIKLLTEEMLPVIAGEKLADFVDVFCEHGFFSAGETERIGNAAKAYGLIPKLHVNQLNSIGGIEAGIKLDACSLDHLETLTTNEIALLSGRNILPGANAPWQGICTLLPSAAFFLRMPLQPARELIDNGAAVALASDFNPGSSPSGNMNFVVALSCIQMRMLPEEAINAATVNGAYAMMAGEEVGSITVGKKANLILTKKIPGIAYLPYAFGTNLVERVMINGAFIS